MTKEERRKPTGRTGPISIGPGGITRRFIEFPRSKGEIELFIARLFCAGNAGMRPQINRYGYFTDLEQQPEDRPDFRVRTDLGHKWLELTEFAPLDDFGHAYENVPPVRSAEDLLRSARALIDKKAAKGYGSDVVLVVYKTHETLLLPAPVIRALTIDLRSADVPFEAIYYVSPHDMESTSTWEIYPGGPVDERWAIRKGTIHIGFDGFEPDINEGVAVSGNNAAKDEVSGAEESD